MISVHTDGGSRGNPGPAAIGIVLEIHGAKKHIGKFLGVTTNNVAEYSAIVEAFNWLVANKQRLNIESVNFKMDSQLAYSQLNGLYKIKNPVIRDFVFEIHKKEAELNFPISYAHIPREQNKQADFMVNQALDNQANSY